MTPLQEIFTLPESSVIEDDPLGVGHFVRFVADEPQERHIFSAGQIVGLKRFTACYRYEPFWMRAAAGSLTSEIPVETQSLVVERENDYLILVPLIDGAFRAALQGNGEGILEVVAESGDPAVVTTEMTALFVAAGLDPYALLEQAAQSVMARLKTGRLRREKALPDFVDVFGWCTWDAFYQDVSPENVRQGLESFAEGGVSPRLLILDDGWLSEKRLPTGEQRLTAFEANAKFPGDLTPTVRMAKEEFGIETFLVWHAMMGYWGGADSAALPGYDIRPVARVFSPGIIHHVPNFNDGWWGKIAGIVPPRDIYRFFQDFHRHLREQGIDGVKVDVQSTLEGVGAGWGGRVEMMRRYREALEGSAQTHFEGNLINCMSCANEMLYSALNSTVTRTSTDFWPNDPASHGLHLYVNAQVSAWFGEFVHPDWDMFQSAHPMGAYHAAGRAVGGCPVYVSDKPDAHDFDLLRKLVLPDGSVLRCPQPGRPTRDCFFHDPTREDILLKIFNVNEAAGVIGVFNARYEGEGLETPLLSGFICPADVEGLEGEHFAVYAHTAAEARVLGRSDLWEITLSALTYEVFTIVPIEGGVAPLGLVEMFNSSGAILSKGWDEAGDFFVELRGSGRFAIWSETAPTLVILDGEEIAFDYVAATNLVTVNISDAEGGTRVLSLAFQ